MKGCDFRACLHAHLCIEVGERFVHEEGARLPDHGAGKGHALTLTAGKRGRLAVLERGNRKAFTNGIDIGCNGLTLLAHAGQ